MDFEGIRKLVAMRSGSPPASHSGAELEAIGDPLFDVELKMYLASCLPTEVIQVSGVRLLPLEAILAEISPGAVPGSFLHRYDYVPIATSIGGNMVAIYAWADRRAKAYWADHSGWYDDFISYEDRSTGEWIELPDYSPENVEKALVPLGSSLTEFLAALLRDELREQLESLD